MVFQKVHQGGTLTIVPAEDATDGRFDWKLVGIQNFSMPMHANFIRTIAIAVDAVERQRGKSLNAAIHRVSMTCLAERGELRAFHGQQLFQIKQKENRHRNICVDISIIANLTVLVSFVVVLRGCQGSEIEAHIRSGACFSHVDDLTAGVIVFHNALCPGLNAAVQLTRRKNTDSVGNIGIVIGEFRPPGRICSFAVVLDDFCVRHTESLLNSNTLPYPSCT